MKCAVSGCVNGHKAECSFFAFPADPELAYKWMQFCRRSKDFDFKKWRICMEHFVDEDFENLLQVELGFAKKRILKRGAVPSIYKPEENNTERSERVQRRENKKIVNELLNEASSSREDEAKFVQNKKIMNEFRNEASSSREDEAEFVFVDANNQVEQNSTNAASSEDYKENCFQELYRVSDAGAPDESDCLRSSLAEEFEAFRNKIESLEQENVCLRNENREMKNDIAKLKRAYVYNTRKQNLEMEELQKRVLSAETYCKNMEEKLEQIFTKRQDDLFNSF